MLLISKERTMRRKLPVAAIIGILATVGAGLANAHPALQSSEPAARTRDSAPKQIRIMFNERILPQFSGIEVKDQAGRAVAVGKATTDPANKKLLVVPLNEELPPGDYTVYWHAVSGDTHRVNGSYTFSVSQ